MRGYPMGGYPVVQYSLGGCPLGGHPSHRITTYRIGRIRWKVAELRRRRNQIFEVYINVAVLL